MLLLLTTLVLLHETGVSAQDQRHLGCYKDTNDERVLPEGPTWDSGNTPERCINFCINRGKTLAGVQFGHQCFCGVAGVDDYTRFGRADGECNARCPGDESRMCGAASRMNIYRAECLPGRFGSNPSGYVACRQECHCSSVTAQCDVRSGACPDGSPRCAAGWKPPSCSESCSPESRLWGPDCREKCGNCEGNRSCDVIGGECPAQNGNPRCSAGWKGRKCDESCEAGSWGRDCSQKCGKCYGNRICNPVNGSCGEQPEVPRCRCAAGFSGEKCTESCTGEKFGCDCRRGCPVGAWGSSCEGICHCKDTLGDENCDWKTGNCEGGCAANFQNSKCERNCQTDADSSKLSPVAAGLVAALVAVAILALIVIVLAVLLLRRRRETQSNKLKSIPQQINAIYDSGTVSNIPDQVNNGFLQHEALRQGSRKSCHVYEPLKVAGAATESNNFAQRDNIPLPRIPQNDTA